MQSLQCVQSIQAIQILEQSSLCATAKRRRGHLPIPKQEKTSSSTRQQETRITFSTNLANATKRPANMMRKNSFIALLWVIGTSSAHTVTRNITLCLLLLSLNLISHTLINVVITPFLKLPSRVAKVTRFDEIAWLWHWRVRGGELRLSRTLVDPELQYGQISTTQKEPFPRRNAHSRTLYSAWSLLLDGQSSCVVLWVVLGLVRCLRWNMGTELGRSQQHVRLVGRFSRARTLLCQTRHLSCIDGQVWFLGATHRAIKRYQKVWRQSWRTARNLIRLGTKRWVNSLGVKWKQHCRPLWAPVRPASRCRILLGSLLQVSTPLSLVGLLAQFPLCKSIPRVDCVETHGFGGVESVTRATYISMPSKPVFLSSGLAVTGEHAVEAVIPGFSAESSAAVQGKSCVDRAVSHGFDEAMSGSCGKDTSPAHLARSQPGVGTQYAHVGYPGVELVSRATYISRKKRNLEAVQRHSKALKKSSTGCETQIHCTTRDQP